MLVGVMTRRCLPSLLLLALCAPAQATPPTLWATVNICDTAGHPDQMGVRASMPGNGSRQRMYMRFRAQFFGGGKWHDVKGNGLSPWILAGSAKYVSRQAGYTFKFDPPKGSARFVLRGVVSFEWRATKKGRTKVRRKATRNTKGGYSFAGGGDPRGYSAGTCEIRA